MTREENMDLELETPTLAGLSRANPFGVPKNYFEQLPAHINNNIFLGELDSKGKNGFAVPLNYINDLPAQIEGKLAAENLKSVAKDTGFSVPPNYLADLNQAILTQTTASVGKPKVVRLWQTLLFKYVSAACLAILMATGLYYHSYNNVQQQALTADLANENMLYDIEESVIRAHIQESQQVTNTAATDAELESYILNNLSPNEISNNL